MFVLSFFALVKGDIDEITEAVRCGKKIMNNVLIIFSQLWKRPGACNPTLRHNLCPTPAGAGGQPSPVQKDGDCRYVPNDQHESVNLI